MNHNDLRRALASGPDGMETYIRKAEDRLSLDDRSRLIEYLEVARFSSVKYEILTSGESTLVKALLIGLLFGQIDVYVSQERSFMDNYLMQFDQLCENLSLSKVFVAPITIGIDEICNFFA